MRRHLIGFQKALENCISNAAGGGRKRGNMTKVITVSREFGSGGRELGKRLADALGYAYYDKEILEEIAKQTETNEWYVEKILEGILAPHIPLHYGRSFSRYSPITHQTVKMLVEERNVIRLLAAKGNCVIVGRGANTILEDCGSFNIFVYADMPSKIIRCRERASEKENLTDRELEKKIRQVDQLRAKSLEMVSRFKWGNREGYHLCINTSGLVIRELVPFIAGYAKYWLKDGQRERNG